MGGYAFFVWLSYGVTAFLLTTLIYTSLRNHTKVKSKISQRLQREIKLRKTAEKQYSKAEQANPKNSVVEDPSKNTSEVIS